MLIPGVEHLADDGSGCWRGKIRLPLFAACQRRYSLICTFPGRCTVVQEEVGAPAGDLLELCIEDCGSSGPSAAQLGSLKLLLDKEETIFQSVTAKLSELLLNCYIADDPLEFVEPHLDRPPTLWEFPGGAEGFLAWLRTAEGISQVFQAALVNVSPVERAGLAGVELHLHCTFEDEHGMSAVVLGDRCIEVGSEIVWRWEEVEPGGDRAGNGGDQP
jgi:hypothetical protein